MSGSGLHSGFLGNVSWLLSTDVMILYKRAVVSPGGGLLSLHVKLLHPKMEKRQLRKDIAALL